MAFSLLASPALLLGVTATNQPTNRSVTAWTEPSGGLYASTQNQGVWNETRQIDQTAEIMRVAINSEGVAAVAYTMPDGPYFFSRLYVVILFKDSWSEPTLISDPENENVLEIHDLSVAEDNSILVNWTSAPDNYAYPIQYRAIYRDASGEWNEAIELKPLKK